MEAAQRLPKWWFRAEKPELLEDHGAMPSIERLLSYEQAGKLLGVTGRSVWTLVDRGDLPAVRFGRSVRIDPVDLRAFIDRSKGGPVPSTTEDGGGR